MELSELGLSKDNFFRYFECAASFFSGTLLSLVLCALIAVNVFGMRNASEEVPPAEIAIEPEVEINSSFLAEREKAPDPVIEYYRNFEYSLWVTNFFTGVCGNRKIAHAVLENANEFNVPVSLAFALCWEESKFNPNAINRYNRDGSIDRGLFQLNSRSFPDLEINDFYNIDLNSRLGISHLKHCLDTGGSEVSALAMYNAGTGRIRSVGAPMATLNYASRILDNRSKIESLFHTMLIREEERRIFSVTRD